MKQPMMRVPGTDTYIPLRPQVVEAMRREREAERAFTNAIADEDIRALVDATEALRYSVYGGFKRALKRATAQASPSRKFREQVLAFYVNFGDAIRCDAPHDFVLLDFLWAFLPRYGGRARTLYRGDSLWNRRRRTYGQAWSKSEEVARSYAANWFWRTTQGGSVLLRTVAPASAIICAPASLDDRYGEEEFIVDRRYLGTVTVLERFPQSDYHWRPVAPHTEQTE